MGCLAASGVLLATLAANLVTAQDIQRALELQRSGDLDGAAREYRAFLKEHPEQAGAHSNLGVVLAKLGRFDEAEAEYAEALKQDPGNPGMRLNLALSYYKAGRIPDAARELDILAKQPGATLQVMLLLADCNLRMGQNKAVIDLLRPVRRANPDDLAVAYVLGTALLRDQQTQEGGAVIDRILQDGESAEAHFLLGSQMFAAGAFPKAVAQFEQAIARNPHLAGLQSYYGQALLITGDPEAASIAFRKELASQPNDYDANLGLAEILLRQKNLKEAAPLLDRALRVRPSSLDARLDRASLDATQGNWKGARRNLETLVREFPNVAAVHSQLADVYERSRLREEAARERALASQLEPRDQPAKATLRAGDVAPDFTLPALGTKAPVSLRSLRAKGPVLLIFGSYTCPQFRSAVPALNGLFARYRTKVPFLLVYIREAHSNDQWQSTRNQREGITLPPATTDGEKAEHAAMCTRVLHLPFPAVVDGLDGKTEAAYQAWPSHAVLVDAKGVIRYSTGLSELDFRADALEDALKKALP